MKISQLLLWSVEGRRCQTLKYCYNNETKVNLLLLCDWLWAALWLTGLASQQFACYLSPPPPPPSPHTAHVNREFCKIERQREFAELPSMTFAEALIHRIAFPNCLFCFPYGKAGNSRRWLKNKVDMCLRWIFQIDFCSSFDWLDSFPKLLVLFHQPPTLSVTFISQKGKAVWAARAFDFG